MRILVSIVAIAASFAGCHTQQVEVVCNPYLGCIPSIEKSFNDRLEVAKLQDNSTANYKLLMQQWREAVRSYLVMHPIVRPLPFDTVGLECCHFRVVRINATLLDRSKLALKFSVVVSKDVINGYGLHERYLTIYFAAIDSAGRIIPKSITQASSSNVVLKKGEEVEVIGYLSDALKDMQYFRRIRIISANEYSRYTKSELAGI